MVLVQVLSDDKVWAHLLAANLRARGFSSRVGDIALLKLRDEQLVTGGPLILDLGSQRGDVLDEYKSHIASNEANWDKVIAVVSTGRLLHTRQRLPSVLVVQRHPDMRKLLPEILELISDRHVAQL